MLYAASVFKFHKQGVKGRAALVLDRMCYSLHIQGHALLLDNGFRGPL